MALNCRQICRQWFSGYLGSARTDPRLGAGSGVKSPNWGRRAGRRMEPSSCSRNWVTAEEGAGDVRRVTGRTTANGMLARGPRTPRGRVSTTPTAAADRGLGPEPAEDPDLGNSAGRTASGGVLIVTAVTVTIVLTCARSTGPHARVSATTGPARSAGGGPGIPPANVLARRRRGPRGRGALRIRSVRARAAARGGRAARRPGRPRCPPRQQARW